MPGITTIALTFLVLLWAQFLFALHPNWMGHSYYDYGWLIPPLLAYFGWLRWKESPPSPPLFRHRGVWLFLGILVLALVPLRIVEHVDPFWRLPLWIHGILVLLITHVVIARVKGRETSRRLLPVTLLIFLTVPLPSRIEQTFVSALTHWVSMLTHGILPFAGYPVEQIGNTFIVNRESVDVAEGCSGIRSFQSCLATGFVLGELQRLSLVRRGLLLLGSVALALVINSFRVVTLVRITYNEGKAAMDAAHDQIGLWAAVATYLLIAVFAWLLDQGNGHPSSSRKRSSPQKRASEIPSPTTPS